ncbi:MAG: hypothetical protein NAOJABEB_03240 [Steroidobacteraceae bacterium]|nr:hypothetical protein [Steroidobacteraceae bacterium]
MNKPNPTTVVKDMVARSIVVSREFAAPVALVWRAYSESALLDQWWGPSPWRAETRHMDFSVGGHWLYAMVGPQQERHWGRMNYLAIDLHRRIDIEDVFCDDQGRADPDLPTSRGHMTFVATSTGTRVDFEMRYQTEAELQKIIEMGFEQGITVCLEQLATLLARVSP